MRKSDSSCEKQTDCSCKKQTDCSCKKQTDCSCEKQTDCSSTNISLKNNTKKEIDTLQKCLLLQFLQSNPSILNKKNSFIFKNFSFTESDTNKLQFIINPSKLRYKFAFTFTATQPDGTQKPIESRVCKIFSDIFTYKYLKIVAKKFKKYVSENINSELNEILNNQKDVFDKSITLQFSDILLVEEIDAIANMLGAFNTTNQKKNMTQCAVIGTNYNIIGSGSCTTQKKCGVCNTVNGVGTTISISRTFFQICETFNCSNGNSFKGGGCI